MVKSTRSTSSKPNLFRGLLAIFALLIISAIIYFMVVKEKFQNSKPTIYFYYMNGCGWCEKMKPEWEKRADSEGFTAVKVNADEADPKILKKLNITGFPAFVIDKNSNKTLYPSNNPRTADGLIEYMNSV